MLRDENNKPVARPMPKPIPMPRREYEYPEYEYPDYDYPMMPECPTRPDYPSMPNCPVMPDYPNNMNPCPYPDYHMYGDNQMDLEEMMRRNPALKRCVMDCIERHNNPYPCRPMPRPRPMPRRRPCRDTAYEGYDLYNVAEYDYIEDRTYVEEMETYDFSEEKVENSSEDLTSTGIENQEE